MKRFILWSAAILLAVIVAVALAFRLSPWPSVAIITWTFSKGDQASEAALEKHVPSGIVARGDIVYGSGRDEILDLYYRKDIEGPQPPIVWVHGGGFIAGSKDGIANYMKVLAGHGYTTVAVEYSKGYGTTYPKPVEQVNAALAFLVRNAVDFNVDPATIVLAGDSAGAQIASQVALLTTDPAYARRLGISPQIKAEQLAAMLLLSGTYDMPSLSSDGEFGWFVRTVAWAYSGVKHFRQDERFQLMSVTRYVTGAFPASFISSGNGDPLAPQAVALARKLEQLGVRVDTLFFAPDRDPPLPHEYQFNLDAPAGEEALNRMLAFLETTRGRADAGQLSR